MTVSTTHTVFKAHQAEGLVLSDATHWWFDAKASIVRTLVRRFGGSRPLDIVDVGAGAGGVTTTLQRAGHRVLAIEGSLELAGSCRRRGLATIRGSAVQLPLRDEVADVVTLLDVIEHLTDPVSALREARRVLRPGGIVVVTVPAHQWLWSEADEFLGHVKRYTRPILRRELNEASLDLRWCSHAFSWLVPPVAIKRRLSSTGQHEPQLGLDVDGPALRNAARVLTAAEMALTRVVRFPFGSSVACVALPSHP